MVLTDLTDRIQNQTVLEGTSEATSLILLLKARLTPKLSQFLQVRFRETWEISKDGDPITSQGSLGAQAGISMVGGRRLNWWDQSQPRESRGHEGWERLGKQCGYTGITDLARWVCLE